MICANSQALARYEAECEDSWHKFEAALDDVRDEFREAMDVGEAYGELYAICGGEDNSLSDYIYDRLYYAFSPYERDVDFESFIQWKGTRLSPHQLRCELEESIAERRIESRYYEGVEYDPYD